MVSDDRTGQPCILSKNTFSFLTNHNRTDVLRFRAKLKRKCSGAQSGNWWFPPELCRRTVCRDPRHGLRQSCLRRDHRPQAEVSRKN